MEGRIRINWRSISSTLLLAPFFYGLGYRGTDGNEAGRNGGGPRRRLSS